MYTKDGVQYENCVICNKALDIPVSQHIDLRYGYVEGAGQLCIHCYNQDRARWLWCIQNFTLYKQSILLILN